MSEEKLIEHTGNVVEIIRDKSLNWKQKAKRFAEEIIVIVIAISLTLLFHNWNDAHHEKKIAREFLSGIVSDLNSTADDLENSLKSFQPTINYYDSVWKQINSNTLNALFIDSNSDYLRNTNYFVFDDGRFQGFQSSGYLRLIENQDLLKHLVTLYTVYMPFERDADNNMFRARESDYNVYIGTRAATDSKGIHLTGLLKDQGVKYQISRYVDYFDERKRHKQWLIKKIRAMALEIDRDLEK